MSTTSIPTREQRLGEFLDDIDTLRGDLAVVRQWFDDNWTAELPTPAIEDLHDDGVLARIRAVCTSQTQMAECARVLSADGTDIRKERTPARPGTEPGTSGVCTLTRRFGVVQVQVWCLDKYVDDKIAAGMTQVGA